MILASSGATRGELRRVNQTALRAWQEIGSPHLGLNFDLSHSDINRNEVIIETTAGTPQATLGTAQLDESHFNNNAQFTPGLDYTDPTNNPTVLTVRFLPGQSTATVQIPLLTDQLVEGDETVLLQLSNPSAGNVLIDPFNATLTIIDATPTVQFSTSSFTFAPLAVIAMRFRTCAESVVLTPSIASVPAYFTS